jgi:hypothetical protein
MSLQTGQIRQQLVALVRPILVSLGWGTSFAAITLWAIFKGFPLPFTALEGSEPPGVQNEIWWKIFYYSALIAISIISPMVIRDVGRSLGGYFLSYVVGGVIIYEVISLPSSQPGLGQLLIQGALSWTFTAIFPAPLFIGFVATIIGAGLAEHFDLGKD